MPNSKTAVMTGSGRYFDPYDPRPEDVLMEDVTRGLRRGVASRFNGQLLDPSVCPHPQSGIAHSFRVGRLVYWRIMQLDGLGNSRAEVLDNLLAVIAGMVHDAPEGYVGDTLGPIKSEETKTIEAVVLAAIVDRMFMGLTSAAPALATTVCGHVHSNPVVSWADKVALYQEALLYQPGAVDWALPADVHGETPLPTQADLAQTLHLFHPREGEDWIAAVAELSVLAATLADDQQDVLLPDIRRRIASRMR